jgi:hypothetical protein
LIDIGRNCLLGNRKKIAKFLMRTFTYRSTFLYAPPPHLFWLDNIFKGAKNVLYERVLEFSKRTKPLQPT